MSQYSYMQDKYDNFRSQYPTPDSTQTLTTNNSLSQPRTPSTLPNSQSNINNIVDSFLSDVEYSTLDNSSSIPTIIQEPSDSTPHTPESLFCLPTPDSSLGNELNSRKQREPILRRSPRITSNRTPQTFEQQSNSTSLKSQESSNYREFRNKNPAAIALEVLNESNDILDSSVHHNSLSYKNQVIDNDDEMKDIDYTHDERQNNGTNGIFKNPQKVSRLELELEHENENEYPESVEHLVVTNEISDTLLRQSEHYNNMASRFSNLKFVKVEPESEEEIEQFTTPITPEIRRSTRKRTATNYSYPRYSYGGSSRRSKTRRRSRKGSSLSVTKNKANVDSELVNIDNERNEEIDNELIHNLPSIEEREANDYSPDIQGADDSGNVNENILGNGSQSNLYLKHDLRSRKILLELPEVVVVESDETEEEPVTSSLKKTSRSKRQAKKPTVESDEMEEEPVASSFKKTSRSKRLAKKPAVEGNETEEKSATSSKKTSRSKKLAKRPILKTTFKKSAKTIPKRRISRRLTSCKKDEDREWRPDEHDNELDDDNELGDDNEFGDDNETLMTTTRDRRVISKTRSSSKVSTTPKKVKVDKKVKIDAIPVVSTTKRLSSKKATPKISKPPKTTRRGRKPAQSKQSKQSKQSDKERGKGRGFRSKNRDTEYKYSGGEETESEVEVVDTVDVNLENRIVQDAEMDDAIQDDAVQDDAIQDDAIQDDAIQDDAIQDDAIQDDAIQDDAIQDGIEQNVAVVEESVSTPTRPKRTQKSTRSSISEPLINTPKSSRSTRSRDGNKRSGKKKGTIAQVNDNDLSNIYEPSDNVPEVQVNIPTTQPRKTTRNARGKGRGGKVKGRGGLVGGNTATDQPIDPIPDPHIVEISSGSEITLANAVRALAEKNFDIVWSKSHWHSLKRFYEETKNEYLQSGRVVIGSEDVYSEVTKKFYDDDTNNRIFIEKNLRDRIIALEDADSERNSEPSGSIQRRSSIESSSSRGSRFSDSRSNIRSGTKRKRSESNATTVPEGENGETENKVFKRHRVGGNTPSGSGATTPSRRHHVEGNTLSGSGTTSSRDMNLPQVPPNNNNVFSRLFGGWFNRN